MIEIVDSLTIRYRGEDGTLAHLQVKEKPATTGITYIELRMIRIVKKEGESIEDTLNRAVQSISKQKDRVVEIFDYDPTVRRIRNSR